MPLHTKTIQTAPPREKPYKIFDEKGLYIEVATSGSKLWRLRYRVHGKNKVLALGSFPEVGLADARALRDKHRLSLREGVDPAAEKRKAKAQSKAEVTQLFCDVMAQWRQTKQGGAASTLKRIDLHQKELKAIANISIHDITSADVRSLIRRIEQSGRMETARRVLQQLNSVFQFAAVLGITERNPTLALRGFLAPRSTNNFAAITTPAEFGALLKAIDGYGGTIAVKTALQILPLIFCRPGELRLLKWADIDWQNALIRFGSSRTKQRREHLIPLSTQVLEHLRLLQSLALPGHDYVFVSDKRGRPFSDATLNAALRRLGYPNDVHVAHGFRSSASTLLSEQGYPPEVIELALGHAVAGVRGVYMRSARLEERREMMQQWSDYCDRLKASV